MNVHRIAADLRVVARQYTRNWVALFFSLIFPIILIALFGAILNGPTHPTTLPTLDLNPGSNVSQRFLAEINATQAISVEVVSPPNGTSFATYLTQNDDTVGLVIPPDFGAAYLAHQSVNLTIYTDPADAQSSGIVLGAVTGVENAFNLQASGGHPIVQSEVLSVGSPLFHYIDYLIPGLIGFAILTSPMFSMVDIVSNYRKEGLFRQLTLTPLTRAEWLASHVLWYVGLTFVSAGIMIAVGFGLFGAHVSISLGILPFLVVGPFLFVSLGMLAGATAKSPESAAIIGNIVTFPMMFLSGTFFPVSSFSPGLQAAVHILPLYYVIDGLNAVMLYANPARAFLDIGVVLAIAIVFFAGAITLFRWREE
jgi:ABC-2 type transport system permease protein